MTSGQHGFIHAPRNRLLHLTAVDTAQFPMVSSSSICPFRHTFFVLLQHEKTQKMKMKKEKRKKKGKRKRKKGKRKKEKGKRKKEKRKKEKEKRKKEKKEKEKRGKQTRRQVPGVAGANNHPIQVDEKDREISFRGRGAQSFPSPRRWMPRIQNTVRRYTWTCLPGLSELQCAIQKLRS